MTTAIVKTTALDGWTLGWADGDDEPRVRDVDLGARLGFKSPIDARKLVRRLVTAGLVAPLEVLATTARTGGRPGREFWLSESEALIVAAKSETSEANAILRAIVGVFIAYRRGELAAQPRTLPLDGTVANSARIGDDPAAVAEYRRARRRVCVSRGYSGQKIDGYVRRTQCVSSPFAASLLVLPRIVLGLEQIEDGHLSLLSPREHRLLAAAKRAAASQMDLFKETH